MLETFYARRENTLRCNTRAFPGLVFLEKQFEEIILQCINDGLSILGEDGRSVVLWLCETKLSLPRKQIPSRIKDFSKLIQDTFGAGAAIIESHIVKEIEMSFNLQGDIASDLPAVVQLARQKFSPEK